MDGYPIIKSKCKCGRFTNNGILCVFCQNKEDSLEDFSEEKSIEELREEELLEEIEED